MNRLQKGKPSGPNGNNAPGPVGMPPQHDASNMHLGPYSHPMQHHHMPPELEQQQQQQVRIHVKIHNFFYQFYLYQDDKRSKFF